MTNLEYYLKLAGFVQRTKNLWRNGLMQVKILEDSKLYFSIYDPSEDKELGWVVDESQMEEI